MIKAKTSDMPSTTARASHFCAGLGDTVERMKCCSSATPARVFSMAAAQCDAPLPPGKSRPPGRQRPGSHRRGASSAERLPDYVAHRSEKSRRLEWLGEQ